MENESTLRDRISVLKDACLLIVQCMADDWLDEEPAWIVISGLCEHLSVKIMSSDTASGFDLTGEYEIEDLGPEPMSFADAKGKFVPFLTNLMRCASSSRPPFGFIGTRLGTFACALREGMGDEHNR
jgi:hypothetical protein